jgi:hypothetical protein
MDRAAHADRMQAALTAAGWQVDRTVTGSGVTVLLTGAHTDDRFATAGAVFAGPTALDALREAVSWAIGEGSEGGDQFCWQVCDESHGIG